MLVDTALLLILGSFYELKVHIMHEKIRYVFKQNLNDDNDGAHLTSFGIESQTEEEAKENKRSPSVALVRAGQ